MAVKSRSSSLWHVLHFLVRFIGLIGLMAIVGGWFVWGILRFERSEEFGLTAMLAGAAAVGFALLFEIPAMFRLVFSHRGAFGLNAALQMALAFAIVIGGNVYSFYHFKRFDLTEDRLFTLDVNVRAQLAQLRGDTDIIVFQSGSPFGHRAKDERNKLARRAQIQQKKIDFAAQRKIIEKVKDLAEQFSDIGPRFHVHVVDIEDENFDAKMAEFRRISEDLYDTILSAPENSVFFYSREQKNIQRLSFSEIYQVDTESSLEDKNLALHFQGVDTFANKILRIEEKSPRIAMAVIHPVLGLQDKRRPDFTAAGAKTTLDRYNIASLDIIMRKIGEEGNLTDEPIAMTYDENRYEEIEDDLIGINEVLKVEKADLDESRELYKYWSESSLKKLNTKFVYVILPDGRQGVMPRAKVDSLKKSGVPHKLIDVDDDDKKSHTEIYKRDITVLEGILERYYEERDRLLKEKATLRVESLAEKRRITDVEAKTTAMLANIDLLIVPRITLLNAATKEVIPNRVHNLDTGQLNAIKTYLKAGKPILFLLGPTNLPREASELANGGDSLEGMLGELGFKLPKQTILYNIESREFNERKIGGAFGGGAREIEVPGIQFDETTSIAPFAKIRENVVLHPLRTSLRMLSRAGGSTDAGEIRIKHPRPVYYMRTSPNALATVVSSLTLPGFAGALQASAVWLNKTERNPDESGVFLITRKESWNEENPYIVKNKAPSYTPPKETDIRKGTVEEPRRGPFPIGVAVEATIPADWFDKEAAQAKTARIAVIGSGSAFVGAELTPMKEKMLLDVINWLIGRDDLLAKHGEFWEFPRVELEPMQFKLWQWGMQLGLPLVFVFLGIVVTMARQMR